MTLRANPITPEFITQVIELACTIQAIPAPTFQETLRGEYFLEQFRALGLQNVERDPIGNVYGKLPGSQSGSSRPLVLSAHMDTVHPMDTPLKLRRFNDRIAGPGIGDNALGLAAVLSLARLIKEQRIELPGDLWLVMNVGEEGLGDLRGIQAIVNRFEAEPLAYLVVEGMGLGTILNRGLGVERYRISIQTPGGHSWVDHGRPSAIHHLCSLVTRLTAIPVPVHPCTTLNVGVIQGGTSINTIAPHAWLELDLRSEDSAILEHLVKEVRARVQSAEQTDVRVSMERIGKRLAGLLPATHPLVMLARDVLSELDIEPHLDIASTDANLPLSRGYPSICVGITYGNHAHSAEEYILTPPVAHGMAQLYLLVTRAWGKFGS